MPILATEEANLQRLPELASLRPAQTKFMFCQYYTLRVVGTKPDGWSVTEINLKSDPATGDTMLAAIVTDKRGYGARWQFSPRHVDNLIAQGLPHLKIGKRRVRILVPEADAWMREKFGQQRRGAIRKSATTAQPQAQEDINERQ